MNINKDDLKDNMVGKARTGKTKTGGIREGPPVVTVDQTSDSSRKISVVLTKNHSEAAQKETTHMYSNQVPAKCLPSNPTFVAPLSELENSSTKSRARSSRTLVNHKDHATNISHSISQKTNVFIEFESDNIDDTDKPEKDNTHKTTQDSEYESKPEVP